MMIEKIINGNNIDVLKTFPDNYFDSVVTDPPYGISFMNKKWDYDVPNVETWKEVYRVLKPGGHMLVACGTRTQHRMAVNIEDAGFEIRDIVAWLYGSGFPKSMDISKALEATLLKGNSHSKSLRQVEQDGDGEPYTLKGKNNGIMGEDRTYDRKEFEPSTDLAKQWNGWGTALKPAMELWTLARKPLIGTVAENVIEYGTGGINIDESRIPFGNETDSRVGTDVKRGDSKKYKYSKDDLEIIKELDDDLDFVWTEETDQFKNLDEFYDFLDDYHFYKPRENTILDFDIFDYEVVILHSEKKKVVPLIETFKNKLNSNSMFGVSDKGVQMYKNNGRFPANVIHDGSDEVVSLFPDSNGGTGEIKVYESYDNDIHFNASKNVNRISYADDGSAARFFYVPKASQSERNYGLNNFNDEIITDGRNKPIDNPFNRGETKRKNIHPTVKPIELMQYLVKMITPKGGMVLDLYAGSGSTLIAAKLEKFQYVGIELDKDYVDIINARIKAHMVEYNIFDFLEEK